MKHLHWGRTRYRSAFERQQEILVNRKSGKTEDTLITTEHDPVYTIGARTNAENHLVGSEAFLQAAGIEVETTNRGGDITYHGPGQLVVYPIIDWSWSRDLHAYLRFLEDVIIATLRHWNLEGARREGKTGIWLEDRKIAAIGVAVKSWITWHGLSLNIDPDLSHYHGIIPCGITDGSVTSMEQELEHSPTMDEVKEALVLEFKNLFSTLQK